MTLLPSLEEILRPPKLGLLFLLPSTKEVVRGRELLIVAPALGSGLQDSLGDQCQRSSWKSSGGGGGSDPREAEGRDTDGGGRATLLSLCGHGGCSLDPREMSWAPPHAREVTGRGRGSTRALRGSGSPGIEAWVGAVVDLASGRGWGPRSRRRRKDEYFMENDVLLPSLLEQRETKKRREERERKEERKEGKKESGKESWEGRRKASQSAKRGS